jgi:hypothetical protein
LAGNRPINADVPAKPAPAEKQGATPKAPPPEPPKARSRKPIPGALKAIGALVAIALVFLIAAVLGGGSSDKTETSTPAPVQPTPVQGPKEKQTPAAEAAEELGYPSFATNNTTRVGGADAASTAAAVALAVYPSTTVGQRPAAVTIVDEGEWQAAVAAAVLMAAPARAPLLVAGNGELPEASTQALEALDPQGSRATQGAQAFAIGSAPSPQGLKTARAKGSDPAALAVAIEALRNRLNDNAPAHVILASESDSEFAEPAAAWAARSGDTVLFTARDKLPKETASALKEDPKTPVYVLGPSSAISSSVVREVAKVGNPVRRVSGEDPVTNAIALARYAHGGFGWNINDPGHGLVLARSDDPLSAAIAAPLSASGTWGPLLLTDNADTLPKALREYLLDIKPGYTTDPTRAFYNHVWVIGDQEAIDVNQQAETDQLAELAKIGGEQG